MAENNGDRSIIIEENSSAVEPQTLEQGWCSNCTCRPHYHVIVKNGQCKCKCKGFELDIYRNNIDKSNLAVMAECSESRLERLHNIDFDDEYIGEAAEEVEDTVGEFKTVEDEDKTSEVFLGEISRGCNSCSEQKLYKDFNNSDNPEDICNYCLWEQTEFNTLDETLTIAEREELLDTGDEIIENEMAFYAAQERQELIDEVLRGLDE